jgi:hypothetical protein
MTKQKKRRNNMVIVSLENMNSQSLEIAPFLISKKKGMMNKNIIISPIRIRSEELRRSSPACDENLSSVVN